MERIKAQHLKMEDFLSKGHSFPAGMSTLQHKSAPAVKRVLEAEQHQRNTGECPEWTEQACNDRRLVRMQDQAFGKGGSTHKAGEGAF